jgi:hypothetical protein
MAAWWTRRRQARVRRREIAAAIRSEWELERPRGLAAVRAHISAVGELERARITSRAETAGRRPARPARERTPTRR